MMTQWYIEVVVMTRLQQDVFACGSGGDGRNPFLGIALAHDALGTPASHIPRPWWGM
jgi:hypothetical protein